MSGYQIKNKNIKNQNLETEEELAIYRAYSEFNPKQQESKL
jgi:hypothetical protein